MPQGRYFIKINIIEFTFLVFITHTMPHRKKNERFFLSSWNLLLYIWVCGCDWHVLFANMFLQRLEERDYLNANNDNSRILKLALKWRKENLENVKWSANQKHCKHLSSSDKFRHIYMQLSRSSMNVWYTWQTHFTCIHDITMETLSKQFIDSLKYSEVHYYYCLWLFSKWGANPEVAKVV